MTEANIIFRIFCFWVTKSENERLFFINDRLFFMFMTKPPKKNTFTVKMNASNVFYSIKIDFSVNFEK